jgi:NADH pyrophosphatase NudC (nudix superfamily)
MTLRPDLTVAAIIERDQRFLLVEEHVGERLVINQPAGHVEHGELVMDAVVRETLEETAWTFHPEALVGIYLWEHPQKQRSFLRVAFCGRVSGHDPSRKLDEGIERAVWLSREQLLSRAASLRSPMVLSCIDDYLEGARHPLDVVRHVLRDSQAAAEQVLMGAAQSLARSAAHPAIRRIL